MLSPSTLLSYRSRRFALVTGLFLILAQACDCGDGRRNEPDATSIDGGETDMAVPDRGTPDFPLPPDTGLEACGGEVVTGELIETPVDIVVVVDATHSLNDEAEQVRTSLAQLASRIDGSNIDARVVLLAKADFLEVPAPLGTDPDRYLPLETFTQQHAHWLFKTLVEEYGRYAEFLRPSAITHFVGISDDEVTTTGECFRATMEQRLGHAFTFHAVGSEDLAPQNLPPENVCECDPGEWTDGRPDCAEFEWLMHRTNRVFEPERVCGDADAVARENFRLASATGGLTLSICDADWGMVFDSIGTRIVEQAPLPCTFAIPAASGSDPIDPFKINVEYTPPAGEPRTIPQVPSRASCTGLEAWHYDDPDAPSEIHLCPTACEVISPDGSARVEIRVGCETIII